MTPEKDKANGAAVIVLPGGGYQFLAMENEGLPVAGKLAEAGYTAFVLKYRTHSSPRDPVQFRDHIVDLFSQIGKAKLAENPLAVSDAQQGIRLVKKQCEALGCDGNRIHVIGFSAGARTLIRLLENTEVGAELNSVALIYPPMVSPIAANPDAPLFMAIAQDDPLFIQGGLALPQRWLDQGGSLEMHLYQSGNHGFGISGNAPSNRLWFNSYLAWLSEVDGSAEPGLVLAQPAIIGGEYRAY